ncbi:MAG: DUF5916 domain-containing protein [Bacteroidota bacterium]
MTTRKIFILASLCFFLSNGLLTGQVTPAKPSFQAVKTDRPVNLSGKLDDPAWQQAVPVELNYEINPGENSPARQRTTVYALYDNEKLYLGFRCYDSTPGNIRSHLSDRDKIFSDDFVLAVIDTYNNYQRGYEFAVNPHGIQGDLLMSSGNEDVTYDLVWQSAAARSEEGWTAEMAIPFKVLTFTPAAEQTWTIALIRTNPRDSRYQTSWTSYDRNNPSILSQGGLLTGLTDIKPGHSLDLLPYLMAQQTGERTDPQDPESGMTNNPIKARIGGGIHYAPGPGFALDAVINPDFSQIESDAGQISVNTTFALYYQEKRPFFMTGSDLLQTEMYYSRTINNPLVASKVTGKTGKLSYIALAALDRNMGIIVPGEEQSNTVETQLNSFAGVGRLRYDIGNENYVGGLWLSRNFSLAHNYLTGVDWNFKFWKNWYWKGELYLTHTAELNDSTLFNSQREFGSTGCNAAFNGEQYFGRGMKLTLMRESRNYSFFLQQENFSPTYQTYNGMYPSVGTRSSMMQHAYTFNPNGKFIQNATVYVPFLLRFNYSGLFKEFVIQPGFQMNLIGQTRLMTSYMIVNTERFRDVLFKDIRRAVLNVQSNPVRGLSAIIGGQIGRFIYRSQNPEMGKGYNLNATLTVDPTSRLKTSFSLSFARLNDLDDGTLFYDGYILRNTTSYQFTKKLFLRAIAEYNSFSNSFNVYPLISYKFNAFTMFCAGMTQEFQNYEEEDYPFRPVTHQYFIKLQYLFSN